MVEEEFNTDEKRTFSHDEAEKVRQEQIMLFAEKIALEATRQERRTRQLKLMSLSVALAVVIGVTTLVASQLVGLNKSKSLDPFFSFPTSEEMFASKSDFESVKSANDQIKEALKMAIRRASSEQGRESPGNLEISVISAKLAGIEERLATIERSISDNPERALSIPMLRKDQDNLSKNFDTNRASVAAEIARVDELQKWILGGIGAVLVTVIAGLLTSLFTVLVKARSER